MPNLFRLQPARYVANCWVDRGSKSSHGFDEILVAEFSLFQKLCHQKPAEPSNTRSMSLASMSAIVASRESLAVQTHPRLPFGALGQSFVQHDFEHRGERRSRLAAAREVRRKSGRAPAARFPKAI